MKLSKLLFFSFLINRVAFSRFYFGYRYFKIICILALINLVCFLPAFADADYYQSVLKEAENYFKDGQYLEAIGAYNTIIEGASDMNLKVKAMLKAGDIYSYYLNNYEKAMELYEIIVNRHGDTLYAESAYINSGRLLYEKNLCDLVMKRFKAYIEKYPHGERRMVAEFMMEACSSAEREKKAAVSFAYDRIRVLVTKSAREARFTAASSLKITDLDKKTISTIVDDALFDINKSGFRLNGTVISSDTFLISSVEVDMIRFNGRTYRGEFIVTKNPRRGMDVINVLGVDDYLYAVLPREMPVNWFAEALKAQAIAARTYAVYQMQKNREKQFDVLACTLSQVYDGADFESQKSNRAVDETKGILMEYDGKPILAYFHSNSGGKTEDAKRVWGTDIPYLVSVDDGYSKMAQNSFWKVTLTKNQIRNALNKNGLNIGTIKTITAAEVTPSGRVAKIAIFHKGKTLISGNEFRMRIDPTLIRSTLFTIIQNGKKISFEGRGYGHGVGLSQWGANVMAGEGFSYEDILKHYYRGVSIRIPQ